MKRIASLLFLTATTSTVFANSQDTPPAGYLSVGGVAGTGRRGFAGLVVDGGYRLGDTPVYVRGSVESGVADTWFADGKYQTYRAGIEARACSGGRCLFGG